MSPLQHSIYKGITGRFGAAQFRLQPPHFYCSKCKARNFDDATPACRDREGNPTLPCTDAKMVQREGAIFMEATSATAANTYDWNNKVVMALGIVDIGKILLFLRTAREGDRLLLTHDPGAKSADAGKVIKTLSLESPKGSAAGAFLGVSLKEGERTVQHKIPVSPDEALVLGTLLQASVARILAWA